MLHTVPPATLDAFRDHGSVQTQLEKNLDQAQTDLAVLEAEGILLDEVTDALLNDGLDKFVIACEKLLDAVMLVLEHTRIKK